MADPLDIVLHARDAALRDRVAALLAAAGAAPAEPDAGAPSDAGARRGAPIAVAIEVRASPDDAGWAALDDAVASGRLALAFGPPATAARALDGGAVDHVDPDDPAVAARLARRVAELADRRERAQERAFLLAAIEASPTGIVVAHAPDGKLAYVNSSALGIRGGAPDDLKDIPVELYPSRWETFRPDGTRFEPEELPLARAVLCGETHRNVEMEIRRAPGESRWVLVDAGPVRDAAGKVVGAVCVFPDVTEERERASSLRVLERAIDAATDGVVVLELAGDEANVVYANPAAASIVGVASDALAGRDLAGLLGRPDGSLPPRLASALAERRAVRAVVEARRPDAAAFWAQVTLSPVLDVRGHATHLVALLADVSERRAAEERVRELEIAVENAQAGVARLDLEGRVVRSDDAFARLLGADADALVGRALDEAVHPRDADRTRLAHEEASAGERTTVEVRLVRPEGREAYAHAVLVPSFDDRARPDGSLVFAHDVTERRAAESALREQLGVFVDGPAVVVRRRPASDADWRVVYASPNAVEQLGLDAPALAPGSDLLAVVHPDDREAVLRRARASASDSNTTLELEYRVVAADGEERWVFDHSRAARSGDGPPGPSIGYLLDVTQRRRDERERAFLAEQLRQRQKLEALGTLASGVAHDFRNLLTAVDGLVDQAATELPDDSPARTTLERVHDTTRHAEGVTRSLLAYAAQSEPERVPLDLAELVRRSADFLRRLLPANVRIVVAVRSEAWVVADATQLHQVLMNLAINARDALPDGGTIDVVLDRRTDDSGRDVARLAVVDEGEGMAPDVAARVFEPFFTTKTRADGTGLGLAVVRGIVEQHGGAVHVDSAPERGTRVEVELPLTTAPPPRAAEPAGSAAPRAERGERVLLAEDSPQVRAVLVSALRRAGYAVEPCEDGAEAAERFEADPDGFALAVLDVDLPRLSGDACLERLRALRPGLPAVLVSGLPRPGLPDEGVLFLPKPFRATDLVAAADSLLAPA